MGLRAAPSSTPPVGLLGIATATAIRGLGVVIPASIAWKTAATVLEHGSIKRGYLGLAGQPVELPEGQRGSNGRDQALLVVGVTSQSPAAAAGVLVGDVLTEFDGHPIESPEDLLDLLLGDRVGRKVTLQSSAGRQGRRPDGRRWGTTGSLIDARSARRLVV